MNFSSIVEGVISPLIRYFDRRAERAAQAERQRLELEDVRHERRVQNVREGRQAEEDWNIRALDNSGWKDEYMTIVLSFPLIGAFVPPLVPYLMEGFEALEAMPDWYVYSVGAMIAAAFSFRQIIPMFDRRRVLNSPNPTNSQLTGEDSNAG
tara:strand:- start:10588 stop:11043 length:456 start_codon:yes stop_codon:yes gene_type:complete